MKLLKLHLENSNDQWRTMMKGFKVKLLPVILLLISIFSSLFFPASASDSHPNDVLRIDTLISLMAGKATIQDVLMVLKSPYSVYLTGSEASEYFPTRNDPIIFLYHDKKTRILAEHHCLTIFVEFNPKKYRADDVTLLYFQSDLKIDEITNIYGKPTALWGIEYEEDLVESEMFIAKFTKQQSKCWVFKNAGMEVVTEKRDEQDFVELICINPLVRKGKSTFAKWEERPRN